MKTRHPRLDIDLRALDFYLFAAAALTLYAGQADERLDTLSTLVLGLHLALPLAGAYLVRLAMESPVVLARDPIARSKMQFLLEFSLFLGVGFGVALLHRVVLGFPFLESGLKLVLGFATVGLFASIDLALLRERMEIHRAGGGAESLPPPRNLYPMTRKFFVLATFIMIQFTGILLLVLARNVARISDAGAGAGRAGAFEVRHSILVEIVVVMGILLGLVIHLILSYAANLRLLLRNQTTVLERVSKGDLDRFVPVVTNDEFGFIAGHTNAMIAGLRDRIRVLEGLRVAHEVQANLLPRTPPLVEGLDIAGRSFYSDETGGDYFDFISRDGDGRDRLGIVVGDVTGHGVAAALLMTSIRALLRLRSDLPGGLPDCLADVNRLLTADTEETGRFITLFYLLVDLGSRELSWVSAGHDPALLYDRSAGAFRALSGRGIPLGIEREWRYRQFRGPVLGEGDVVVLGTDGIWEARNGAGDLFGKERLREVVRRSASRPSEEIVDAVARAVGDFRGSREQDDDITLVVLKGTAREKGADG